MTIGIVNYQIGNLGSLFNSIKKITNDVILINNPAQLDTISKIILPGVGNFNECMDGLVNKGWSEYLARSARVEKKPLLGICLGMQVLATTGFEGAVDEVNGTPGLNIIPGEVVNLSKVGCKNRIPHVGWNNVKIDRNSPMYEKIPDNSDFYFVHEFTFIPEDDSVISARCDYGVSLTASLASSKVWGTQFHPEKSSSLGFQLLTNFVQL